MLELFGTPIDLNFLYSFFCLVPSSMWGLLSADTPECGSTDRSAIHLADPSYKLSSIGTRKQSNFFVDVSFRADINLMVSNQRNSGSLTNLKLGPKINYCDMAKATLRPFGIDRDNCTYLYHNRHMWKFFHALQKSFEYFYDYYMRPLSHYFRRCPLPNVYRDSIIKCEANNVKLSCKEGQAINFIRKHFKIYWWFLILVGPL